MASRVCSSAQPFLKLLFSVRLSATPAEQSAAIKANVTNRPIDLIFCSLLIVPSCTSIARAGR
jgi:hypothetical protein